MSEYSSLKATINANVKTNGNQEITGSIMNSVLNAMIDSLGAGYQFIGVATPTNPGSTQTPDYKCFYLATTPGTYTNLGRLVVADGEVALLKYDSSWTKEVTGIAAADKLNQLGQEVINDVSINLRDIINNNQFDNSDYWRPIGCSVIDNGDSTYVVTNTSTKQWCYINWRNKLDNNFVAGHLYYCYAEVYSETAFYTRFYIGDNFTETKRISEGSWESVYGLHVASANNELGVYFSRLYWTPTGDSWKIRRFICFDITEALGVTTLTELDCSRIASYIRHYLSYNLGNTSKNIDAYHFVNTKTEVLVAASDSLEKDVADFICSGKDDQCLINKVIQIPGINKITFAKGTYNITAPINLKSNLKIVSNGARFENNLDTYYDLKLRGAFSVGETHLVCVHLGCEKIVPGSYLEIVSADDNSVWGTFLTDNIDYANGFIYIADFQYPNTKGLQDQFPAGSVLRNVSSCFAGYEIENVTIDGIEIYWNYPDNARCPETFWAQNGIHLCRCSNVLIQNSRILSGGRHGILTYFSKDVKIIHCICSGWGEHGIDLYDSNYEAPMAIYNIVDGCECKNNTMSGIQAHSGSRCRIVNNYCANNRDGITDLQTTDNIISNNICESNTRNGIMIDASTKSIIISSNICMNSGRNGIETDQGSTDILIEGNILKDCGWYGIQSSGGQRNQIQNNRFANITYGTCIKLYSCLKNIISDNLLDGGLARPWLVEDSECDYTICKNNTIIAPMANATLVGVNSVDNGTLII